MKKARKFISIQTKIYRILFMMITAGTFLCSFGTFGVLYRDILEKSKMDYQMLTGNVMFSVNSNVEDVIRCSELILTNRAVVNYLQNQYDQKQDYSFFLARANVEGEVKNITAMNSNLVESIVIVDRKGDMLFDDSVPEYRKAARGFFRQEGKLYYSCPFLWERPDQEIGRLFVGIKEENMFSALAMPDQASLRILLADGDGNHVAGSGKEDREWKVISQEAVAGTDWQMTARINANILAKSIWKAAGTVIALLISVLAVSYLVFQPVLRRITKPLVALTKEIKNFKEGGENRAFLMEVSNDEIGMIAKEYGRMVDRIRKLIRRLQKQKETEIHLYMAQVNPHFIYNTLYALICVAEKKHETEIAEKIRGVANILCLSLYSKPESFHMVREEIEAINQYLDILRYKYGEGIEVEWLLEPGMEEESIHVLLLYPLVENAVFHGLSQAEDKHLTIMFKEDQEEIRISVADNGVGMSKEEIYGIYGRFEQWMDKIEEEEFDIEMENTHVGLFNLRLRLFFLYGERANLTINSKRGEGTRVVIGIRK